MAFIPDEAVYSSGEITHAAFKLYTCYCANRNKGSGTSWPSRDLIHRETGISRTYISSLKTELFKAGWIDITNDGVKPLRGFLAASEDSQDSAPRRTAKSNSRTKRFDERTDESDSQTKKSDDRTRVFDDRTTIEEPAEQPLKEPSDEPVPSQGVTSLGSLRPRDLLFEAVAEVCQIDWKICPEKIRGELNQTVGILRREGQTEADVRRVGNYWY